MNGSRGIIIAALILLSGGVYAQKQTRHVQQAWFGYINQTRLSDKWGLWGDLHLRTREDFVSDLSSFIARAGITYHANERLRFTAGYAFVNHFPAEGHSDISRPEHRPWQQMMWNDNHPKSRLTHSVRLEERFRKKIKDNDELADGYNFNYRLRYNLLLMLPLGNNAFAKNSVSAVLNNEVMVNFGKEIVNNYFDQNRFFAGFAYHVNAHSNIQFGYLNVFIQQPAGSVYRSINAPRIFFFHNIDARKKS